MSRLRTLLAWLVLAAIPLQGLAAASMLYCGTDAPAAQQQGQTAHHEHATHGTGTHGGAAPQADIDKQLPDATHKCGVCASCCTGLAIVAFAPLLIFPSLPQAESAEPFVLIHARPSQVPDKPPRA